MTADALDTRLQAQRSGAGWTAKCSAHDDHRESLSIGVGQRGRVLLPDRTYRNHLDMTCAMLADENIALRALLVEALGDAQSYRELAQQALHALADLHQRHVRQTQRLKQCLGIIDRWDEPDHDAQCPTWEAA